NRSPSRSSRRPRVRRCFLIDELEERVVLSPYVVPGSLSADTILIRRYPANTAMAQVLVNGTVLLQIQPVAGDTITVNALGGHDPIDVKDPVAGVTLTINGDDNNDTINVGSLGSSLDNVDGNVIVNGGNHVDTLNIDDRNNTSARTYTVTSASVSRDAS